MEVAGSEPARRRGIPHWIIALGLGVALVGGAAWWKRPEVIPMDGYRVVKRHPHDPEAFTQGLLIDEGRLFESTGHYGKSEVREVELESGKVLRRKKIGDELFGEGLAAVNGELIQITWRAGKARVWGRDDFTEKKGFDYEGEGWGLTWNGEDLIMSDGTDVLSFRDPETFAVRRRLEVTAGGSALRQLNELEWVEGEIWANVYQQDRIARIDPESGKVTRWIDLEGLLPRDRRTGKEDVLNGIAWDAAARRLYVTGKFWPELIQIEVVPEED